MDTLVSGRKLPASYPQVSRKKAALTNAFAGSNPLHISTAAKMQQKGRHIMLYRTLKRMIERGQMGGIETKIDIFFAAGKLTEEEYNELIGMLNKDATAEKK